MKKIIVFATMVAMCLVPIGALAQYGGGYGPPPIVTTFWAKATIIPWWGSQPIEAAEGIAYVTLSAGDHSVGMTSSLTNEPFNIDYAGSFDVDENLDFGSYDSFHGIVRTDGFGNWRHEFPKSSSIIQVPIGTHVAQVKSDIFNVNALNGKSHAADAAGFTVR